MRFKFAGVGLLAFVLSIPSIAVDRESQAREFFGFLEAEEVSCPPGLEVFGSAEEAFCAATDLDLKSLNKSLRRFKKQNDDFVSLPGPSWTSRGEFQMHRMFLNPKHELYLLVLEPSAGFIALMPDRACLEMDRVAGAPLYSNRDDTVSEPTAIYNPQPEYPERARVERRSGIVAIQVVVDGQGTVTDSCVSYAVPEGVGFAEEGLETVRTWRYEPARKDGEAVAYALSIVLTWELR